VLGRASVKLRAIPNAKIMKTRATALLAGSALALFALISGCSREAAPSSGAAEMSSPPSQPAQSKDQAINDKVDKHVDEALAAPNKAEARQWLKPPGHVFFKANKGQVAQLVEDFYVAGATQVFFAEIARDNDKEIADSMIVVLPKDSTIRAKVFSVGERGDGMFDNDPTSDTGQKYLYYGLD
jgi:hypothetical protein